MCSANKTPTKTTQKRRLPVSLASTAWVTSPSLADARLRFIEHAR